MLVAAALVCASVPASATVPIAAIFSHAHYSNARLSPNGKYLAARVTGKNGHDVLTVIARDTHLVTEATMIKKKFLAWHTVMLASGGQRHGHRQSRCDVSKPQ